MHLLFFVYSPIRLEPWDFPRECPIQGEPVNQVNQVNQAVLEDPGSGRPASLGSKTGPDGGPEALRLPPCGCPLRLPWFTVNTLRRG